MLKPTVIAIPFFALMIAFEYWYDLRQKTNEYDKRDAWTNIALGFGSVAFGAVFGLFRPSLTTRSTRSRRSNCRWTRFGPGFYSSSWMILLITGSTG